MQGFLNLNKPPGFTSHDCVAKVRRLLRLKRVGHGGTLDPAATGVLPIALGRATRLLPYLRQDKAYQATIRLGVCTTTDDLEGEILQTHPSADLDWETVGLALQAFQGQIQQIPPNYSAIQVDGKRLYKLARAGQEITVEPRLVEVFELQPLDWRPGDYPELDVAIACGSGTYIRAIARDLGQKLGRGGTLAALTRTQSSGFCLSQSLTLEALEQHLQQNTFTPISPDVALHHLPTLILSATLAHRWCHGQKLCQADWITGNTAIADNFALPSGDQHSSMADQSTETPPIQIQHEQGHFLGIGQFRQTPSDMTLIPQVVYQPNP